MRDAIRGIPHILKTMLILNTLFEFFGNVGPSSGAMGGMGGSSYDNNMNTTNAQRSLAVGRLLRKIPKQKPLPFKFNVKKYSKTHP